MTRKYISGDQVRNKSERDSDLTIGKVYTVVEVDDLEFAVRDDVNDRRDRLFSDPRWELASSKRAGFVVLGREIVAKSTHDSEDEAIAAAKVLASKNPDEVFSVAEMVSLHGFKTSLEVQKVF